MVAPWSLPVGLDCAAIAAAAARRWHRDDPYARHSLAGAVVLSGALQVADALHIAPSTLAPVLYAVPPLAAWLAFEMFLRSTETAKPRAARASKAGRPDPVPAKRQTARLRSLDELMPIADEVASDLARDGRAISRRALNKGIRARTGKGLSTARIDEVTRRLSLSA